VSLTGRSEPGAPDGCRSRANPSVSSLRGGAFGPSPNTSIIRNAARWMPMPRDRHDDRPSHCARLSGAAPARSGRPRGIRCRCPMTGASSRTGRRMVWCVPAGRCVPPRHRQKPTRAPFGW